MNSEIVLLGGVALVAYLIGSISFAVVVSQAMGLPDPHSYGSGNPGATNVLRTGNKKAAIFTLLGDFLKGAIAVWLAKWAAAKWGADANAVVNASANSYAVAFAALAVFLGHCWPIFHRFKGGKGVATAGGIFLGVSAALGGLIALVWLLVAMISRMSSLAAILTALAAPFVAAWWLGVGPIMWAFVPISLILVARHRANIGKILAGTENKIGQRKRG
jgi:acyl phosphate:glycerol-3-phosphate acyltransferase